MSEPSDALAKTWTDVRGVLGTAAINPLRLTRGERLLLAACILAGGGVSILGLLSSYSTLVAQAGQVWGWQWPWLLPVGLDLAIPAFTLAGLLLIRVDMPLPWVRWVPRSLTAATVYLNWTAGHATAGRIGHAVLIGLWVVFSEIAAHVYATRIGAVTGKRMEKIRRSRWLLAPRSTVVLWRRMVLWEITSYPQALTLERERLLARAALRERYGSIGKAPERIRVLLRLGALTPDDIADRSDAHTGRPDDGGDERDDGAHSQPGTEVPDERPVSAADERTADAQPGRSRKPPRERPTGAQRKDRKSAPKKTTTERRRERTRALYDELDKRPEWTEIRDALVADKLAPKTISRPTCQRIRDAIEKTEPQLAALGQPNVRTLTGS